MLCSVCSLCRQYVWKMCVWLHMGFWGCFANLVSLRMLGKACLCKNFIVHWKLTVVKLGEKRNDNINGKWYDKINNNNKMTSSANGRLSLFFKVIYWAVLLKKKKNRNKSYLLYFYFFIFYFGRQYLTVWVFTVTRRCGGLWRICRGSVEERFKTCKIFFKNIMAFLTMWMNIH